MSIDINNLTKQDTGRYVVYTSEHGTAEIGRIKSWNNNFIFVVYKCDNNWNLYEEYTAAATKPDDLTFKYTLEAQKGRFKQLKWKT